MANLLPSGKQQYFDPATGKFLVGGKLYTYLANTSLATPKATYTNQAGNASNTNPIILDAYGQATVFWSGAYDVVLKDSSDNIIGTYYGLTTAVDITTIIYDGVSLDTLLLSSISTVVNSITALKALDKTAYTRAYVTGYYVAGDGGGGHYWYDSSDTTTADNSGSVIVATDGGRWKLLTNGKPWSVLQFGAKPDYTTDATTAIQAAMDALSGDVGVVTVDGAFLIGNITVPAGCTLKGNNGAPSQNATGTYSPANHASVLVLPSANSITFSTSASHIEGVLILEQDLAPGQTYATPLIAGNAAAAVANFAGTAIKLNTTSSYDCQIKDCLILGFEYVCNTSDADSTAGGIYSENVYFDCTQGMRFYGNDTIYSSAFQNCRGEPFLTAHLADATKDQRTGVAFETNTGRFSFDDCQVRDKNGFLADNSFVTHNTCAVKNDNATANSFYGFKYTTGGFSVVNSGCTALNCGGGNIYSYLPVSGGVSTGISVVGANLDNYAATQSSLGLIYIRDGGYNISATQFGFNGTYGAVGLHADADYGTVDNCSVFGTVQPFAGDAAALLKMRVGYINYRQTPVVLQPLTWTPVFTLAATPATQTSYGHFTITNQHVTAYFDIALSAKGAGAGNATITGLPYTAANETNTMLGMGACGYYANVTTVTGAPTFSVAKNTAVIDCWDNGAGASTALTNSDITDTTRLVGWVTYRIAQ